MNKLYQIAIFKKDKLLSFLGLDKMSNKFKIFSTIHLGFLMFYTLQVVFMNTLLRRISGNNDIIFLYNMIFYSFIPVGMTFAVYSVKKRSCIFTIQSSLWLWIGILIITLSLIITGLLQHFWILLSLASSLANGCYWIAYYMALTDYTSIQNRDVGLSVIGIYTGIANILIPIIGGYFINKFIGYTGYIIMFSLAGLISLFCILSSKQLVETKKETTDNQHVYMIKAFQEIVKDKIWFYSSLSEFFRGTREGVFIFYLNVLVFSITENEALVGINAFIAGIINIISNWLLGKLLYKEHKKDNKPKLLTIAVSSLFSSSFLLLLNLTVPTLIIMTCINAFFSIFIQNITQSIFCTSVQCSEKSKQLRAESFVLKSYFLAFGRLIGILFIHLLPKTNFHIVLGIVILTILQSGTVLTSRKTIKLISNAAFQNNQ